MKPDDRATIFLIGEKPLIAQHRENAAQAGQRRPDDDDLREVHRFLRHSFPGREILKANAPKTSRQVIVALTDGEDNWSDMTR